jgi:hypothetical protein
MPYHFEFAPSEGILRCTFQGAVNDELIEEYYGTAAKWVAKHKPRSAITDFSDVTTIEVSTDAIARLARSAPIMTDAAAPRFVVASSAHIFGMARMFQLIGEKSRAALRVVRTLDEAYAALGVKEPHYEPVADLNPNSSRTP